MTKIPWNILSVREPLTTGGQMISRSWFRMINSMWQDLGEGQATESLVDVAADKFLPPAPSGPDNSRAIADLAAVQAGDPSLAGRVSQIEAAIAQLTYLMSPLDRDAAGASSTQTLVFDLIGPPQLGRSADLDRVRDEIAKGGPRPASSNIDQRLDAIGKSQPRQDHTPDLVRQVADLSLLVAVTLSGRPGPSSTSSGVSIATTGAGISASPATITSTGTLSVEWNAGTANALGATSLSLSSGTLIARTAAKLQAQWVTGAIVQNDTIYFSYDPPYPGTINTLKYFANTGSFTVAVQIAGSNVTGMSSVNVNSSTPGTATASAANTFSAGQAVTGVITGAGGSPTDALLSLDVTWGH